MAESKNKEVNIFKEEGVWPVGHVPKDIICKNCKYQKPPCKVRGKMFERYTHCNCFKYENKPNDVLWKHGNCIYFEEK